MGRHHDVARPADADRARRARRDRARPIRARTGEGRERAKARGVKIGRKPKLTRTRSARPSNAATGSSRCGKSPAATTSATARFQGCKALLTDLRIALWQLNFVATDSMEIEFDPVKSAKNAKERGLPFDLAAEIEWQKAVISIDERFMYGEERRIAFAPCAGGFTQFATCCAARNAGSSVSEKPTSKRSGSTPKRPLTNKDGEVRPLTAEISSISGPSRRLTPA